jgi:hypothetical protein
MSKRVADFVSSGRATLPPDLPTLYSALELKKLRLRRTVVERSRGIDGRCYTLTRSGIVAIVLLLVIEDRYR